MENPTTTAQEAPEGFFAQISRFAQTSDINITISAVGEGQLAVSVLPKPKVTDAVKDRLAPLVLRASPASLDEGFFAELTAPLSRNQEFYKDLSAWEAAQQKAEQENRRAQKQKEELDKLRKKADVSLQRAEELIEGGKATAAVTEAEKAVALEPTYEKAHKKLAEIREKAGVLAQASLFGDSSPIVANEVDTAPAVASVDTAPVQPGGDPHPLGDAAPVDTATKQPASVSLPTPAPKVASTLSPNPLRAPSGYFRKTNR